MDASASKKQKHCDSGDEDRISKLPDSILCHILSFLPTIRSVRTSCLSRRWRHLWASVPVLDFEDFNYACHFRTTGFTKSLKHFERFVNTVLILRRNPSIQKFRLRLVSPSTSYADSWILAASARNVEELDISVQLIKVSIPTILFDSKKLVTLKLSSSLPPNFPDLVNLPSLKVLHLYCPCPSYYVNKIMSGCPVLEDLSFYSRHRVPDGDQTFSIVSASLKRFSFRHEKDGFFSVMLDAPLLESLHLTDVSSLQPQMKINSLSSIAKASFHFNRCCVNLLEHSWLQTVPVAEKSKIEVLSRSFFTLMKVLAGESTNELRCWGNLKQLELRYCGSDFKVFSAVLDSVPDLQLLELKYQNCKHAIECEALGKKNPAINCLKHSLKSLRPPLPSCRRRYTLLRRERINSPIYSSRNHRAVADSPSSIPLEAIDVVSPPSAPLQAAGVDSLPSPRF